MPVRNALDALTMRPTQFLASAWPWRSLVYLAGGALVGIATIVAVTILMVAGVVLSVAVVGIGGYLATVLAGVAVGRLERRRMRLVDFNALPNPHRPAPHKGLRAWVTLRLREQATWRELAYTMVSALMLCWMDGLVVGGSIYIPLTMIAGPFYIHDSPLSVTVPVAIAGFPLAVILAYPVTAWAGARAAMARAILAPRIDDADAKLVEVTRSRARLVDAFELERRRIERDLHDGAQQRLVALTMQLGMAKLELPDDSPAGEQVGIAHELAKQALIDLRELIRGVHPKVLTDRGLAAAVEDVAATTPIPVDLRIRLPDRLPSTVEVTAYFVVVEALTNVAKHSDARRASVDAEINDGRLVVEIRDDGRGDADPVKGSGLVGLADRVSAVDGVVAISSPSGGPTLLRVEIPVTT